MRALDREPVFEGERLVVERIRVDRIVLLRNHRFAVDRVLWELPAGTLDANETPRQCAARELAEETGYQARELEPLCAFFTAPGFCDERMHAFVATGLTPGPQRLEATEEIEVAPLHRSEVLAMAARGEIEDSKTLAILFSWTLAQ